MRFIVAVIYLALNCFAADQSNKPKILSTTKSALEQHVCVEESSDELLAYAIGCFFASEQFNPVVRIGSPDNVIRFVNYEVILEAISGLSFEHSNFIRQKLDMPHFRKLIFETCDGRTRLWGNFGELRRFVVQSAKEDECAISVFEVAILKWVVQSLEQGGDRSSLFFPVLCSSMDFPRALLGLELLPSIPRLCRRELDVLFDGLVGYYQKMFTVGESLFSTVLDFVITLDKKSVAEKLLPPIIGNYVDHPEFTLSLLRYVQLRSPNNCPYASEALERIIHFDNQPRVSNEFAFKIWVDHDPKSPFLRMASQGCLLQDMIGGEFVLQAEMVNGNISWTTKDFVHNYGATKVNITAPTHEYPHQLYVTCPRRPPPSLTTMLINQCKTEEGMKELLKSSKFKYLTMAIGVTMFEASHIQCQD